MGTFDWKDDLSGDDLAVDEGGIKGISLSTSEVDDKNWGFGKITEIFFQDFISYDTTYIWSQTKTGVGNIATNAYLGGSLAVYSAGIGTALIKANLSSNFAIQLNSQFLQEATFETMLLKVSSNAGTSGEFGFYYNATNFIRLRVANNAWYFETCKGGVTTSSGDLGEILIDETVYNVKIVCSKSAAFLFVNGAYVRRINTNVPDNVGLFPYAYAKSTTADESDFYFKFIKTYISRNK